ncbi:Mitochondrial inner membrane magnesium transporter MRS2 [Spathaspora sp. JA1]|nr:Mitochondrial inner membrane magnesium transporter MRS2 [Spathaspora sp. JA1]
MTLSDEQVKSELTKMQAFIEKEAKEKAKEIKLKADEEYEIEKASIVRSETSAIDSNYEAKLKKASLAQQITKSTISNKTRLRILTAKDQVLNEIFEASELELKKLTESKEKYLPVLTGLIEEGLLALMEEKVSIKVRQQDLPVAQEAIVQAASDFQEKSKIPVEITIKETEFLNKDIAGGVVVLNGTGKIEVNNTLEERLKILSEEALPALRLELFGPSATRNHIRIPTWYRSNSTTTQGQPLRIKPVTPNDLYVSCTTFDRHGTITAVSKKHPKTTFLKENHLFPRDLRKIDTSSIEVAPTIMIRPNDAILVNLLHIKAIIKQDSVMVFDTSASEAATKLGVFMYDLELKLKSPGTVHGHDLPFEFRALESILVNVMSYLETEIKLHESSCGVILSELEDQVDRHKLQDLLIRSKKLSSFYQKAVLIRDVLEELLENDEDLAGMYLSQSNLTDFDDLEMLLESYYRQCDEFVQHAGSLLNDIKATEEIVNIILDANRNSLMLFELKLTVYTLGFTVATLVPAFYGMNLKNYIEESNFGFGSIVVISLIQGVLITLMNYKKLQKVQKLTMMGTRGSVKPDPLPLHIPSSKPAIRQRSFINKLFFGPGIARRKFDRPTSKEKDVIWRMINDEKLR